MTVMMMTMMMKTKKEEKEEDDEEEEQVRMRRRRMRRKTMFRWVLLFRYILLNTVTRWLGTTLLLLLVDLAEESVFKRRELLQLIDQH